MEKIRNTKLGAFLKDKAPDVLSLVGDLLPDKGAIGMIKNAINMVVPSEEKAEIMGTVDDMSEELLKDVQNAREMYKDTDHTLADNVAKKIINWNLIIIMALVGIQVYVIMSVDGQVAAVITGVVGTVVGSLINERNTVVNFLFGSSMGSKSKDK